jgi:hypothetical protein
MRIRKIFLCSLVIVVSVAIAAHEAYEAGREAAKP